LASLNLKPEIPDIPRLKIPGASYGETVNKRENLAKRLEGKGTRTEEKHRLRGIPPPNCKKL
jgi:hypothetical protein